MRLATLFLPETPQPALLPLRTAHGPPRPVPAALPPGLAANRGRLRPAGGRRGYLVEPNPGRSRAVPRGFPYHKHAMPGGHPLLIGDMDEPWRQPGCPPECDLPRGADPS